MKILRYLSFLISIILSLSIPRTKNIVVFGSRNGKRLAEKKNNFGSEFIELARNVYKINDQRAKIKLNINNFLGSNIKEVKSYD